MRKSIFQLFDEFIYEAEFVKKVRTETIRGYKNTFSLFMNLLPQTSIETLSNHTVTEFFKILEQRKRLVGKGTVKTGIKKSTVATYWSKLNAFFSWLEAKKHINNNPFSELAYPTPSYEDRKFLKKEEVEKIITAIHTHHDNNLLILKRNLVVFYILLFCGLRREELLMLQVRDIDFERKLLTIRADTSKSGKIRQVPLHSSIIMYLKDYLQARKSYTTPFLIVSSKLDARLTLDGLVHLTNRIKNHSGVPFHLHQFRHTFAVNFLNSSNNVVKLKQLMGHKNISMTLIYLRCLPVDHLRGDVENMSIDKLI